MSDSTYRWVIVAAGGLLGCVAIGAMFSLPVFLLPISKATGWSVTSVSSAMTIGFIAMALASMAWGTLADRIGPRPVVFRWTHRGSATLVEGTLAPGDTLALATSFTVDPRHTGPWKVEVLGSATAGDEPVVLFEREFDVFVPSH